MAPLQTGLCAPWPYDTDCMDVPAGTSQATIDKWVLLASEQLFWLTGRRLGASCPVTVRPCRKSCWDAYASRWLTAYPGGVANSTGGWFPVLIGGEFYNISLCGCQSTCHCGPELCEIELAGPVYQVDEVNINGTVLPASEYNVLDGRYLVRRSDATTEGGCWTSCQDMSLPPGQPDTFAVTYRTGLQVPVMGRQAVAELAAHYIRGCAGGCGCGVGARQNLQRLSRQGVDLEFADPQEILDDGRTGIPLVDAFISAMNPHKLASPLRVLSPDAPKYGRVWS